MRCDDRVNLNNISLMIASKISTFVHAVDLVELPQQSLVVLAVYATEEAVGQFAEEPPAAAVGEMLHNPLATSQMKCAIS